MWTFHSSSSILLSGWSEWSSRVYKRWSFSVDVEGIIDSMSNSNCSAASCFPIIWMLFNHSKVLWNWTRMTVFTLGRFKFYTKFSLYKFRRFGGGVQEHDFRKKLSVQFTPSMFQENGSVKTPSVNYEACERKTVIHWKKYRECSSRWWLWCGSLLSWSFDCSSHHIGRNIWMDHS